MNDIFNGQKDILISIKKEISLLQQQVDYLLRNGKALGPLDLDVMMNRTHDLYDMMCSVDLGEDAPRNDEEVTTDDLCHCERNEATPRLTDRKGGYDEEEEEPIEEEETVIEENEDAYFEEEVEEEPTDDSRHCEEVTTDDAPVIAREEQPKQSTEEEVEKKQNEIDDLGFILNFEPTEPAEEPKEEPAPTPDVFTPGDKIEMTIPHKEEIPFEPIVIGDMEEKEDSDFELETPETLADKLQQVEDHSLAAKLQHSSVNNLNNAIGINDKFLLVNELFGGSMEKYNKSINNLNDLKTLEGALVYMNELRIDLQWNSNNEAYKKLLELVHRKFD